MAQSCSCIKAATCKNVWTSTMTAFHDAPLVCCVFRHNGRPFTTCIEGCRCSCSKWRIVIIPWELMVKALAPCCCLHVTRSLKKWITCFARLLQGWLYSGILHYCLFDNCCIDFAIPSKSFLLRPYRNSCLAERRGRLDERFQACKCFSNIWVLTLAPCNLLKSGLLHLPHMQQPVRSRFYTCKLWLHWPKGCEDGSLDPAINDCDQKTFSTPASLMPSSCHKFQRCNVLQGCNNRVILKILIILAEARVRTVWTKVWNVPLTRGHVVSK